MSDLTVRVPKNPDERLALDLVRTVWPLLSYLRDAPPRLGMVAKIAMSNTMWGSLRILTFEGSIRPVDPIAGTLFGHEVVACNWPRDRVELMIPVQRREADRAQG
jgi:hypothetical protein